MKNYIVKEYCNLPMFKSEEALYTFICEPNKYDAGLFDLPPEYLIYDLYENDYISFTTLSESKVDSYNIKHITGFINKIPISGWICDELTNFNENEYTIDNS